jgi:hypothetical protein
MKPRPRPRRAARSGPVAPLEPRTLLATAAWLGQTGQDLVGPYPAERADGIQDVQVRVTGLPADRPIVSAELMGLGGSRWTYNLPGSSWRAAVRQAAGSTTADLFVEADRLETGRPFNLVLTLDDGTRLDLWFDGGAADPTLRMAEASLAAAWLGQTGADLTGPGAAVGPDGRIDAAIGLTGLAAENVVATLRVTDPNGMEWVYGLNPEGRPNAELVRDDSDPSRGTLYLSPGYNLAGRALRLDLVYATGQTDSAMITAGAVDPSLAVPPPPALPRVRDGVTARWVGQDGVAATAGRGWARIVVSGLPSGRTLAGATLSAGDATLWAYRAPGSTIDASAALAGPLAWSPGAGGAGGWLAFEPESATSEPYTLRLEFDDGSMAIQRITPGAVDLSRLSPSPLARTVVAAPGANLAALARQYGRIELAPGTFRLTEPLVLDRPVTIAAPRGGATLLFAQPADAAAWGQAILIHAGNVTLDGVAIRFEGPVRWDRSVPYGPAVIGTTDLHDNRYPDPKAGLAFTRLDVESPPAATDGEEAPRLFRLVTATSGRIVDSRLRGGAIEVLRGSWAIERNRFEGTPAGTWAWDVIAAHRTHDLSVRDNVVDPLPGSGRIWRFAVLTGGTQGAAIAGNRIRGLGHVDTDTDTVNANELILTEAYALRFEGRVLGVSADGAWLDIPPPQGDQVQTGDLVTILDGPEAGRSVRVAQAVSPTRLLLADPLPAGIGTPAVAIGPGQLGLRIEGNTIDLSGSSTSSALVLVGYQAGTVVAGNTLIGGGVALRLTAFPTERPVSWGWSHTPATGVSITGNTFLDAADGALLTVEHGPAVKSTTGRTYLTGNVTGNVTRWTRAFLDARAAAGLPAPTSWTLGDHRTLDPSEMVLTWRDNRADVPEGVAAPAARVIAGRVNGTELVGANLPLDGRPTPVPGAPTFVRLLNDTGLSGSDGLTNDPRLVIGPAEGGVSYEYRLGATGAYTAVVDPAALRPAGVADGEVEVRVRARNAEGVPGPETVLRFTLDRRPPGTSAPVLDPGSDTGLSDSDGVTRALRPVFRAALEPGDRLILERDGVAVAEGATEVLIDAAPMSDGVATYRVRRVDAAGNESLSEPLSIRRDRTAPAAPTPIEVDREGWVRVPAWGSDERVMYRVAGGKFTPAPGPAFEPLGLRFGPNVIELRTVDTAGNVSETRSVTLVLAPSSPRAIWIGQDGSDRTGLGEVVAPDGRQDVRIALGGLPPRKAIRWLEVRAEGGRRWGVGASPAIWRAVLVRRAGATTADLYYQPDRRERGKPLEIRFGLSDGTELTLRLDGGEVDPRRPASPPAPQPAGAVVQGPKRPRRPGWHG